MFVKKRDYHQQCFPSMHLKVLVHMETVIIPWWIRFLCLSLIPKSLVEVRNDNPYQLHYPNQCSQWHLLLLWCPEQPTQGKEEQYEHRLLIFFPYHRGGCSACMFLSVHCYLNVKLSPTYYITSSFSISTLLRSTQSCPISTSNSASLPSFKKNDISLQMNAPGSSLANCSFSSLANCSYSSLPSAPNFSPTAQEIQSEIDAVRRERLSVMDDVCDMLSDFPPSEITSLFRHCAGHVQKKLAMRYVACAHLRHWSLVLIKCTDLVIQWHALYMCV